VLNAPEDYTTELAGELPGVALSEDSTAPEGAVLLFVNSLDEAARLAPEAARLVQPAVCFGSPIPRAHRRSRPTSTATSCGRCSRR